MYSIDLEYEPKISIVFSAEGLSLGSLPSIKIENKGKVVSELYDLVAVRIIVNKLEDCYIVLGIIFHIW